MIFNLSQGGVSVLSVTAPSGAAITATCDGLTVTGTGTCALELPVIGTWTVTCVYDGVTKSTTQEVTTYGAEYSLTFAYTATLVVTTFPGATVAISKTGYSDSQTATGGTATFTIPAGQLGTYSIISTYSSWSGSATSNVSAYDASYSATVDLSVCDFTFTPSGQSAITFTKDTGTGSNSYYYFYHSGANWEFYAKTSGTLQFTAATVIDVFLCGGGNNGVNPGSYNYGCDGGNGGRRRTVSNQTVSGNVSASVGAVAQDSSFGSLSSSSGTASAGGGHNGYSTFYAGQDGGYCFDDASAKGPDGSGRRVGAGGGHGAWAETGDTIMKTNATNGGSYGGGAGGNSAIDGSMWYANNGSDAASDSFGCGGGGAGTYYHDNISDRRGKGSPGSGSKGFVAMRNKR